MPESHLHGVRRPDSGFPGTSRRPPPPGAGRWRRSGQVHGASSAARHARPAVRRPQREERLRRVAGARPPPLPRSPAAPCPRRPPAAGPAPASTGPGPPPRRPRARRRARRGNAPAGPRAPAAHTARDRGRPRARARPAIHRSGVRAAGSTVDVPNGGSSASARPWTPRSGGSARATCRSPRAATRARCAPARASPTAATRPRPAGPPAGPSGTGRAAAGCPREVRCTPPSPRSCGAARDHPQRGRADHAAGQPDPRECPVRRVVRREDPGQASGTVRTGTAHTVSTTAAHPRPYERAITSRGAAR